MPRRGTPLPRPRPAQIARPTQIDVSPYSGHPHEFRYRVGGMPPEPRPPQPRRLHPAVFVGWTVLTLAAVAWIIFSLITY